MHRLYLLDDHPVIREGLRSVLEGAGYRVVGDCGDPDTAWAALEALQPDVLLLDLDLAGRSGLELLERLKHGATALRSIVLTGSVRPQDLARAVALGARGYVTKDASAGTLCQAIEAVMAGQRRLPGPPMHALPVDAAPDAVSAGLSPREREVLLAVVGGQSSRRIGERLGLSPKTVDSYRSRLMNKVGASDVPALVRWAIREGLVQP